MYVQVDKYEHTTRTERSHLLHVAVACITIPSDICTRVCVRIITSWRTLKQLNKYENHREGLRPKAKPNHEHIKLYANNLFNCRL